MNKGYLFNCAATAIGSMPHTDADKACGLIFACFNELPHWPQLPLRSPFENMVVQFAEGMAGAEVNEGTVTVRRSDSFDSQLEQLYLDYDENAFDAYKVSRDYASGLYSFVDSFKGTIDMVKGQITGPISFGLMANDENGKGILYDELTAEAAARLLRLKAAWQEAFLRKVAKNTVIFVDEPSLSMLGSAFVAISNEQVGNLLEEVLGGIQGIKGIHCCGGTDWSILLNSSADIISFDTYGYAESFECYASDVESFIRRGGTVAWGIMPNVQDTLQKESGNSLLDRLEAAMAPYTKNGISLKQIASQSIITPSCSLSSLSEEAAGEAMRLLSDLSVKAKQKFGL